MEDGQEELAADLYYAAEEFEIQDIREKLSWVENFRLEASKALFIVKFQNFKPESLFWIENFVK